MSGGRARRLLRASAGLVGARLAGAGIGLLTQLLLARTLSPDGLGIFFTATSLASVAGLLAASGYPSVTARLLARYRIGGHDSRAAAFVRRARRDTGVCALVLAAAVATGAWALPGLPLETRLAGSAAALAIPAIAATRVHGAIANAQRRFGLAFLPDLLLRPALFLLLFGAAAALGLPVSTAFAVGLTSCLAVGLAIWQAARLSGTLPTGDQAPSRRLVRRWRGAAWPLAVVALVTALFADLDLVLLAPLLPAAELAVFGVCLKLSFLVGFAVQALHQVTGPDLAESRFRRDGAALGAALRRCNMIAAAVALAALLGIFVLGPWILALFGPEFASGYAMLVVLTGAQLVRAVAGPAVPLMTLAGAQRRLMALAAGAILALVLANLALVPLAGGLGAAVAVVASYLVWSLALAVALHRRLGLRADLMAPRAKAARPAPACPPFASGA